MPGAGPRSEAEEAGADPLGGGHRHDGGGDRTLGGGAGPVVGPGAAGVLCRGKGESGSDRERSEKRKRERED